MAQLEHSPNKIEKTPIHMKNSESKTPMIVPDTPTYYSHSISDEDLVPVKQNALPSRQNSKKSNRSRLDSLTENGKYPPKGSLRKAFLQLFSIFLVGALLTFLIFKNLPEIDEQSSKINPEHLKFPKNLTETRNLGRAVKTYVNIYPIPSYFIYFFLFIFLQSFFIPTSFLSIISGMIFNPFIAITCLAISSAIGSLINYYLASTVGIIIVDRYFKKTVSSWRSIINKSKFDLIRYLFFLRMIPVPAWSVNIACAIFRVDVLIFFLTTLFGVIPMNTIFILTGRELEDVIENPSVWNWKRIVGILALCSAVLLPSIIKKYFFKDGSNDKGSFEKLNSEKKKEEQSSELNCADSSINSVV